MYGQDIIESLTIDFEAGDDYQFIPIYENDIDNPGTFGVRNGAFEINDMEGTQCTPPFSITNGFNDNQGILLSGVATMGYCNVSIQVLASTSSAEFESCLNPNQLNPFGCTDFLGSGPGGDAMLIELRKGNDEILKAGFCGSNREGRFIANDLDINPGDLLQVFITGGTQAIDESYYINEIRVTGFPRSFVGAQLVASNDNLCAGREPLILTEVTGGSNYRWEKDGVPLTNMSNTITIPLVSLSDMGTYTVTFTESGGCEATGSIDVVVQDCTPAVPDFSFEPTYCESDTVELTDMSPNGVRGTWSEESPVILLNRVGRIDLEFTDDGGVVHSYNFEVLPSYKSTIQRSLCNDETFEFNGTVYDPVNRTNGIEIITDPGTCDSIFFIEIELLKDTIIDILGLFCQGDTPVINGVMYSSDFFQNSDTIMASNGCDSILNINLTFLPIFRDTLRGRGLYCPDEIEIINGLTFDRSVPGRIDTFQSVNNCDSIVVVELEFIIPDTSNITINLCPGESRLVGGVSIDETVRSGQYFSGPNNCDSLIIYDVEVYQDIRTQVQISLCPDQDTTIGGQLFDPVINTTGEITLLSSTGCDSTIEVLILSLRDTVVLIRDTLCYDEGIEVGSVQFDRSNPIGQIPFTSANGCDSLVLVELSFYPDYMTAFEPTYCPGQSVMINGVIYDESNLTGTEVLTSATGCDSTVVVSLNYATSIVLEINGPLCEGESIIVDGVTYDEQRPMGSAMLSSSTGCDTVVIIDLSFMPTSDSLIQLTLCGEDSLVVNGTVYNRSNNRGQENMMTAMGCDSIISLELTFLDPIETFITDQICPREEIVVNGQVYDQNRTNGTESMMSNTGCDSTIYVDLVVLSEAFTNLNLSLCTGDTIIVNGEIYDESQVSGMEVIIGGAANGCDSIVTIDLTFSNEIRQELDSTVCSGSVVVIDGEVFDAARPSGEIRYTSRTNCDSIVVVTVLFDSMAQIDITGGILDCNTTSLEIGLTTDGTQAQWVGPNGFRSVQMNPTVSDPGVYTVTVENATGCISMDSITIVGEYSLPEITIESPDTLRCMNSGIIINANTVGDIPEWSGPNNFNQINNSIVVFEPGVYTATVVGPNGCIDSASTEVVLSEPQITLGALRNTCDGLSNGSIEISNIEGLSFPITLMGIGADTVVLSLPYSFDDLAAGDYMVLVEGSDGCAAQEFITITDDRSNDLSISSTLLNITGVFALSLNYNAPIAQVIWEDIPGLSCYDCIDPVATITTSATYSVSVIDVDGCTSNASIELFFAPSSKIYIPNVINLNSANGNEKFYPQGNFGRSSAYDLTVFDRWGSLIHEERNSLVNDPNSGWSGILNGSPVPAGVYAYVLTIYEDDGTQNQMTGAITLVKE